MMIPVGTDQVFNDITGNKRDGKSVKMELACPAELTRRIDHARAFFSNPINAITIDFETNQQDKSIPDGEVWRINYRLYICTIEADDSKADIKETNLKRG